MYETDIRTTDYDTMLKLSELFNVSMYYLYEQEPHTATHSKLKLAILYIIDWIPKEKQRAFLEMTKIHRDSLKKIECICSHIN